LDYISNEITSLGDYYKLSNQTFSTSTGQVTASKLTIANTTLSNALAFSLTPPTPNKETVVGKVVLVANEGCNDVDYPEALLGHIALVQRGTCPFGTKSELAGKAGAVAAIIYNNQPGNVSGTLGTPSPDQVPTWGISQEEAALFVAQLKNGTALQGSAFMDSVVRTTETYNVVAQTTQGDQNNCIVVGGHSDSVPDGPGLNDDGTGTLTLLEIASQLSKYTINNCVIFAWFSAEEVGLVGSDHFTNNLTPEDNQKIRLMMNYDMLASPNFAYQIYNSSNAENPAGSEQIRDLYIEWYKAKGIPYTFIEFDGRSDYDGFVRNGIPASGIMTGAEGVKTEEEVALFGGQAGDWYDPCYHKLCDNVNNVNLAAWEINSKLVAHSVATYAKSLEGFPARAPVTNGTTTLRSLSRPDLVKPAKVLSHDDHAHGACGRPITI
jgi:aminopeptidase Y